jgi:hypothetical protein
MHTVPFELQAYETGWDKDWEQRDNLLLIQAHAPSNLLLQAQGDGHIRVRAKVKTGGRTVAVPLLNGKRCNYDVWMDLDARAADFVQLEVTIQDGSKDQCWTYWEIEGATIGLANTTSISFWTDAHLGDSLGILVAADNFARANGIALRIRETQLFHAIVQVFHFSHIELVPHHPDMRHIHPFGYDFERQGWVGGIIKALRFSLGGSTPSEIRFPSLRLTATSTEEVVLFQFDTRSETGWPAEILREVLARYSGSKLAAIGGLDTKSYLGPPYEYRRGDLSYIAEQLLACKKFVGIDSGIAHLACILGIEVDLLPSKSVGPKMVRAIFGHYPRIPNFINPPQKRVSQKEENSLYLSAPRMAGTWGMI